MPQFISLDLAAAIHHRIAREILANADQGREVVRRVAELAPGIERDLVLLGQVLKPDRSEENAGGVRWVAVRILAAAGGNGDGLVRIALSIQQAHHDVSAVDLGIDIEFALGSGAREPPIRRIQVVLLIDQLPGLGPVVRILGVPAQHVADALVVLALRGDAAETRFDDLDDIRLEERLAVHAGNELTAVKTVAIVHQPPEFLAQLDRHIRHPRRDQAGVIRLDLIVDVVGVLVELGMPRIGWSDAAPQVIATRLVGVPERIATVGEIDACLANRDVESVHLQRPQERHFHVDVVLLELVDQGGFPFRHLICRNDNAFVAEFGGPAPANAGHLADPSRFHLVDVFRDRDLPGAVRPRRQPGHRGPPAPECADHRQHHNHQQRPTSPHRVPPFACAFPIRAVPARAQPPPSSPDSYVPRHLYRAEDRG